MTAQVGTQEKDARAVRRAQQGYRLVVEGERENCLECGQISDLKGDPRRGYCLRWQHMVGGRGVCRTFSRIPWQDQLPHRIAPAGAACKSADPAAAAQHVEDREDLGRQARATACATVDDGSNPSGRASSVRDTSMAAYRALVASGKLSRQQLQIMAAFERWPARSFTRQELRSVVGMDINVVTARVKELLDLGAIVETGKRICRVKQTEVHELRAA